MITFHLTKHATRPNVQVIEILHDGQVCATIVPTGDDVVRIISAHFFGVDHPQGFQKFVRMAGHQGELLPIPTIDLVFEPRPYTINDGNLDFHRASRRSPP